MNPNKPSIVFFGTGDVAAASLELLAQSFEVEAVVTKPKPEHHKGSFPVIDVANIIKAPLLYVTSNADVSQNIVGRNFVSQVAVLIDFGIIVSRDVINTFPLGIINSHFSLLPELRGADPITFALLSGQKRTGVSLMKLVEAMDEGPLLGLGIQEDITALTTPELTHKLILLSYALLRDLLPGYINGKTHAEMEQTTIHNQIPGYPSEPTYSRKLSKADGEIDFTKSAEQLEREVRAFLDWPRSRTLIAGKDVVITKTHVELSDGYNTSGEPGTVFRYMKELCVRTSRGVLVIDKLKPAGKTEMDGSAFLSGYARNL